MKNNQKSIPPNFIRTASRNIGLILFVISSIFVTISFGFVIGEFKVFPYQIYAEAKKGYQTLRDRSSKRLPWYYLKLDKPFPEFVSKVGKPYEGLTLLTGIEANDNLSAKIINAEGKTVHQWDIDWFKMWPNPKHLSNPEDVPQAKPGTNIQGAIVMENGDLIFNFTGLGLIRIDKQGKVVWRLPYQTHHSVHRHDDGNLWVSGKKYHTENVSLLPHLKPPFYEETILEVTPDGEILREWSIPKLLRKNGYAGLLYLGTLSNASTKIKGDNKRDGNTDLLHLNDVEPFPSSMKEDFFKHGDVMVSLRNINAVFIFNSKNDKIKFLSMGQFIRQHDPDFIDGNTFSVFDNNNGGSNPPKSLIVIVSARENTSKVFFEGSPEQPFYTPFMGAHQWQPNGNLLITESKPGRGFEINQQGEMVWQHVNYVDQDRRTVAIVLGMQRLPVEYNHLFHSGE